MLTMMGRICSNLVDQAILTNQKPTIYRNLYENTGPGINITASKLRE